MKKMTYKWHFILRTLAASSSVFAYIDLAVAAENPILRLNTYGASEYLEENQLASLQRPINEKTNLPSIVLKALRKSPKVKAASAKFKAAKADVWVAKGQFLPVITGKASVSVNRNEYKSGKLSDIENGRAIDLALSLKLPLFSSGANSFGLAAAKEAKRAAAARLDAELALTTYSVVDAYLSVQRSREVISILNDNLKSFKQIFKAVDRKHKAGEASGTDLSLSLTSTLKIKEEIAIATTKLKGEEATLKSLSGDNPPILPIASEPKLPSSLKKALKIASEKNSDILSNHHDATAASLGVKATRGRNLPSLHLLVDYSRYTKNFGSYSDGEELVAKLQLDVPILNVGAWGGYVAEKSRAEAASYEAEDLKQRVMLSVENDWQQLASLKLQEGIANGILSERRKIEEGAQARFNAGLIDVTEVLQAKITRLQAKINLVDISFEARRLRHKLSLTIGQNRIMVEARGN